jgi:DNA-binding MarR family transcriptional regulator
MKKRRTAIDDGSTPESDAAVLTARLGELLAGEVDHFFSAWGLTLLQFNVLRILYVRDPDRNGISRGDIEAKLIRRVPDVTRLLDRLEGMGVIERIRPDTDRRTVLSRLTDKGLALVEDTHQPLLALNRKQFAHMTRDEVLQLIALVRKAAGRARIEATSPTKPIGG